MPETWTVLGLPVSSDCDDDLAQPLAAVAVVKGFDQDGQVAYWIASSDDVTGVEALGMLDWAAHKARTADDA